MKEIIQSLVSRRYDYSRKSAHDNLIASDNVQRYISSNPRFLIPKRTVGAFFIDFTCYYPEGNTIYFIPPFHLLYFHHSLAQDYLCIEFDWSSTQPRHKQLLHKLYFKHDKSMKIPENSEADWENCLLIANSRTTEHSKITMSVLAMFDGLGHLDLNRKPRSAAYQLDKAEVLLSLLSSNSISLKHPTTGFLATELYVSESSLGRITFLNFEVSPKHVLKYTLMLKAIFLIGIIEDDFTSVTYQLGFSSPAVFARFIKRLSGLTPSEIRKRVNLVVENKNIFRINGQSDIVFLQKKKNTIV